MMFRGSFSLSRVLALPFVFCLLLVDTGDARAQRITDDLVLSRPPGFGEVRPGHVETKPISASPFSISEAETMLLDKTHQREHGWTAASEEDVSEFEMFFDTSNALYSRGSSDLSLLLNELRVVPASFDGTLLSRAKLQTAMHIGGFVDGAWTGLVRVMTVPSLGRVVLEEYDYVAAGSYFVIAEEIVDFQINGRPATFDVWRAPSRKSFTELVWFTENKHFRLLVNGTVQPASQRYRNLIELAWALR